MKRSPLKRKYAIKRGKSSMKRTPLSPVSKDPKKKAERALYKKLRTELFDKHPKCQFETEGVRCTNKTQDLHHIRGRGKYITDSQWFMAICRRHHDWIHANPAEAKELGYLISGIKNYNP